MSEPTPTLGARLRAAREAKALSAQKIADQLHLDAWVIEALESGDYARIGPAVYGKGHLKRYAGALGLPVADIIGAYDAGASGQPDLATPPAGQPMPSLEPVGGRFPSATVAGFGALALIVAGVFWWRPWQPRSATPAAARVAAKPVSRAGESAEQVGGAEWADADAVGASGTQAEAGASGVAAGAGTGIAAPGPGAHAAAPATGEGDSTAGAGRARLRLSFSADSWVDVRDAAGLRLYAGQGRANSVRTIAGAAPMRVYLGFASGVQLKINNRVVAIGPKFVDGDVARFEAGADGVLRRDAHAAAAEPHPRG